MLYQLRRKLQCTNHNFLALKQDRQEIIQKTLVRCRENQGDAGRIKVQALSADFRLALQAGEIEMGELLIFWVLSGHYQSLYCLCEEKLMMERYEGTLIL